MLCSYYRDCMNGVHCPARCWSACGSLSRPYVFPFIAFHPTSSCLHGFEWRACADHRHIPISSPDPSRPLYRSPFQHPPLGYPAAFNLNVSKTQCRVLLVSCLLPPPRLRALLPAPVTSRCIFPAAQGQNFGSFRCPTSLTPHGPSQQTCRLYLEKVLRLCFLPSLPVTTRAMPPLAPPPPPPPWVPHNWFLCCHHCALMVYSAPQLEGPL